MSEYTYTATIRSITDGDTVRCDIDLGFNVVLMNRAVRLAGINAPEMRTPEGVAAREYLLSLLPVGSSCTLVSVKDHLEKYGRILGVFYWGDPAVVTSVNDEMIDGGHAVAYMGKM